MAVSPKLRRDIVFWGLVAATSFAFNRLDTQKRSHFHTAATSHNGDHGVFAQTLAVCVLSMLANIGVVAYHSTFPPHPKFTLLPRRRLCLHIHIAAGIVEIFGMTVAFFAANPTPFAYLAVAAAFLGHIPSAIYQWCVRRQGGGCGGREREDGGGQEERGTRGAATPGQMGDVVHTCKNCQVSSPS